MTYSLSNNNRTLTLQVIVEDVVTWIFFETQGSPHIRLKLGEIRFINLRFITEKPRVSHFSPKLHGPLAEKLKALSMENMVRTSFIHMPSSVKIGLSTATRERKVCAHTTSTIHKQHINKILPVSCSYGIIDVHLYIF